MMSQQTTAFLTDLERLKDRPRLVVIVAHGLIELTVNELIRAHCKHAGEMRRISHYRKMIVLNEMDVLPDSFFNCLNRLRDLRNRSVNEPRFDPTQADLSDLAQTLDISLPGSGLDLVVLCSSIIQSLLNQYEGILRSTLAGGALGPITTCQKGSSRG